MSRQRLFSDEPVAELRGLSSLTDPDAAGGVIDVAVFGARGDGKTQFIVHAIRTLRAHAPALGDAERGLNREVLRVVMDPRAPRPEATPPGFVPHYTFRVRPGSLLARLRWRGALRLLWRASAGAVALGGVAFAAALLALGSLGSAPSLAVAALGAGLLGTALASGWLASRRLKHADEFEVAFWDIAGEHVYSASAADYYSLLASLIEARKRRAAELGRPYAFAPVLLCNPIALGTKSAGSPFERLRQLLPLFAAIDDQGGRALIAVNRWSVVDPICARGALRDEIVAVTALALGEDSAEPKLVARDVVRRHCLDTEDGRDGDVVISHLRYDTAIRCSVELDDEEEGDEPADERAARKREASGPAEDQAAASDAKATAATDESNDESDDEIAAKIAATVAAARAAGEAGAAAPASPARVAAPATAAASTKPSADEREVATAALTYRYDEGPGAFTGDTASRFLDWLMRGLKHPMVTPARARVQSEGARPAERERGPHAQPASASASSSASSTSSTSLPSLSPHAAPAASLAPRSPTPSPSSAIPSAAFSPATSPGSRPRTSPRLEVASESLRGDPRADRLEPTPAVAAEIWARPADPGRAR